VVGEYVEWSAFQEVSEMFDSKVDSQQFSVICTVTSFRSSPVVLRRPSFADQPSLNSFVHMTGSRNRFMVWRSNFAWHSYLKHATTYVGAYVVTHIKQVDIKLNRNDLYTT